MKQIKRITLIAVLLITTLLQGQTKVFNSQVRIKQVPLSSSLDSLVTINSSGLLTYLPKSELVTEAQTLSFSNGQLTISDANTIDLDTYYYSQTDVDGLISSSAGSLEFITEGGNTGIAIKGRNPDNYGNIGEGAVDLSFSNSASSTKGATGDYSLVSGQYNTGSSHSLVSGLSNTGGIASLVSGLNNTGGVYSLVSGQDNTGGVYSLVSGRNNEGSNYSLVAGVDNSGSNYSLVSGRNNTGGDYSLVSGRNNTGGVNSLVSGQNNTGGFASLVSGIYNTAPSYAESTLGMFGTNYTPNSTTTYNADDRLFNLGNGTSTINRSDAFTIYKSGNATLNGDLTVDNIIGNGSQLTNVAKLNQSNTFTETQVINKGIDLAASANTSNGYTLSEIGIAKVPTIFVQRSTGALGVGYGVKAEVNSSGYYSSTGLDIARSALITKSTGVYVMIAPQQDTAAGDVIIGAKEREIYHGGNSAPTRTIDESTLQTSATLNSAFPFADNPDGTIVVNKDSVQSFMYIRVNSTQWKAVSLGSAI